jgi:hypothetical protein
LTGTTQGNRGAQGVMFEVATSRDVTVKSFDFYTDAARTDTIQVYTRPGSYVGKEQSSTGWTSIYNRNVQQNGQSVLSSLNGLDTFVTIPANSTQSFYIVTATANYIMYDAGIEEGRVLSQDNAIAIKEGESNAVSSKLFW